MCGADGNRTHRNAQRLLHVALLPLQDLLQIVTHVNPIFCYSISIALFLHLFHILKDRILFQREKEKDAIDEYVHNKKAGHSCLSSAYNVYCKSVIVVLLSV